MRLSQDQVGKAGPHATPAPVNAPSDPVRVAVPSPDGPLQTQGTAGPEAAPPAAQPKSTGAEERRKLTGRAGIVAAGTLVSRILGLLRDLVIAATFTAKTTDAFFVAFTIPNVLRQLLAEGAVQNAALPVLEATKEREGEHEARRAYASLRGLSLLVLTVVTVLGMVFAPQLVELFATGYHRHEGQFERTVTLTRWLFPYIFFMGTAALGMAALNLHRRFVVTSFAPGLLNLAFIACSFGLPGALLAAGRDPVLSLAIGALLGGVLQVAAQWPSLRQIGYLTLPRLDFRNPKVRQVLRRMGPVLIGIGIYYVDVVLARRFLSELEVGSQSYFGWALRLCDFPQGIFVMALQTATLPSLSRLVARGETEEVEKTFSYALRLTLFVGITASVAAVVLAEPLTVLIFQRGHFDATSSRETARALAAQGLGIWMVAVVRQLVALYYAFGDTRSPVRVAALDLVAFVLLALLLRGPFGHVGISLAVTGASLVQMVLLAVGLRHRLPTFRVRPVLVSATKTFLASGIAAAASYALASTCSRVFAPARTSLVLALPGLLAVVTFACVFVLVATLIRSEEIVALTATLRRRRSRAV